MKKILLIILVISILLFGCQKEVSTELSNTNTSSQLDVYVAGYEEKGSYNVAKYWKNGQAVELTDGTRNAWTSSITVVGSDVYVAGGEEKTAVPGDYNALYWKNGNPVTLSDDGDAISIAVSGNDVYVAGSLRIYSGTESVHACYWKNGNVTLLPDNTRSGDPEERYPITSKSSLANSIFISGGDIYIAGGERVGRETSPSSGIDCISAVYWKNGNEVYLIKGGYGSSLADEANSIFVAGQDVYACGALEAQYWKNGTYFYLAGSGPSSGLRTEANSICVSGSDVYVAGTQSDGEPVQGYFGTSYRDVAKYWKNGIAVNLSDGTKEAYATSIAVSGNDVYVAGGEEKTAGTGDYVAKYWKNGSPVILGDVTKYSEAYSIFLVKK